LPNSHIAGGEQLVHGKKMKVRVLELSRKENKIVFSQKTTISANDFESAAKQVKEGEKIEATITNITPFGMFVTVPVPEKDMTLDGLIHISEVAWEKVDDLNQLFSAGQKVEAAVIGFDKDARRVDLSIKRLIQDPFEKMIEKYPAEKKVTAAVIKIDDNGVYLDLEEGIEALIRKDKIPPTVTYKEGQSVTVTIAEVDRRRHRITLLPVLKEKPLMYR
jgi:small subunit ribosomal protein S1